jgi:ribose transport system permease protein
MYAVGANERAAVLAGIPTASYTLAVFVAAGLCAGVGGVLAGAQLGTAQAGGGDVLLIGGLTGALLSITTIQVGRYNVLGTAVAIYTLAIAITGFQQMGAPTWIQPVFNGVALIIALTASGWALRARAQRAKRTQLQLLTEGAGDYK